MSGLRERANDLAERLKVNAGINPLDDRFAVGYLAAVEDILNITYEEIKE